MIRVVILYAVIILGLSMPLSAQSFNDCEGIPFTYFEKTATGIITRCSLTNQPDPDKVKLKKMPFRLCVDWQLSDLSSQFYRNVCDPNGFGTKFVNALNAALNAWNNICPPGTIQIDYVAGACDGEIEPIARVEDWKSQYTANPKSPTADFAEAWPGGYTKDGIDLPPRIIMNFTKELSESIAGHKGIVWAFDGQCSQLMGGWYQCNTNGGSYDKWCISVESILLHEIGHILGLGHPDADGCNVTSKSAMADAQNGGYSFGKKVELYDKCAIKSIYCPEDLTSINYQYHTQSEISVFPNPAYESLMIQYPSMWRVNMFRMYDIIGNIVFETKERKEDTMIILDINRIPKGTYYLVLYEMNWIHTKMIKVE
ncbi:MAG: T9SS type A sorting domain-containing protein [Bacteroidota bacterium]|jgi:hypothetical protein